MRFFVDYDVHLCKLIYVNFVISECSKFIIFDYFSIFRGLVVTRPTKCCFCKFSFISKFELTELSCYIVFCISYLVLIFILCRFPALPALFSGKAARAAPHKMTNAVTPIPVYLPLKIKAVITIRTVK